MDIFNYSYARQKLSYILQIATNNGEAKLKDKEGNLFIIKPACETESPLDIKGIGLKLTGEQILDIIQEARKYK